MDKDAIIKEINRRYLEKKMQKYPYTAPELLPQTIQSDQVQVVVDVLLERLDEIIEDYVADRLKTEKENILKEIMAKINDGKFSS